MLDYRHFGEIEDGVDMRAEVALLTRNVKIEGVMSRGCPANNENCENVDFDTYGAHTKVIINVFQPGAPPIPDWLKAL